MNDIIPNEEFWRNLGFDPKEVVGHINGPNVRKGLTGWSTKDLKKTLNYTKEGHTNLLKQPRDILLGMIARNAPKSAKFLTLINRYVETVKPIAIKKIAEEIGVKNNGLNKNSLALEVFFKNKELLKAIQLHSLTIGLQSTYPYWTIEKLTKPQVTSKKFKEMLMEELHKAPSLSNKRIRINRMETTRGGNSVTYYIEHEDERHVVNEWDDFHYDQPKKWIVISFYTKLQGVEIRTMRKKVLDDTVKILGHVCFGKSDSFTPFSRVSKEWIDKVNLNALGLTLEHQILRSLTIESVNLDGSPNLTLTGVDILPAIKQLKDHKGIELTNISGWEVHLSIKKDGVIRQVTVNHKKRSRQLTLTPPVPLEYRSFIYLLREKQLIPSVE